MSTWIFTCNESWLMKHPTSNLKLKGVPVQDVCIRSCLPMWAVMFVCLCASPLVCLASVQIATANANVLVWDGLKQPLACLWPNSDWDSISYNTHNESWPLNHSTSNLAEDVQGTGLAYLDDCHPSDPNPLGGDQSCILFDKVSSVFFVLEF